MKQCSKCHIIKPITDFHKDKRSKHGVVTACKPCINHANNLYRQANIEKYRASAKKSREKNSEKVAARHKNWRLKNLEKHRQNALIWQKNNPDKSASNRARRKVRLQGNGVFLISPKFLKRLYNSVCVYCGSKGPIQADHIIPIKRGGTHSEGNLQPLCAPCNYSKNSKTMMEWKKGKK